MSSTRSDTELLDRLEALLGDAFVITLKRNWFADGRAGSWNVTFKSESHKPGRSMELRGGDESLRAALNRACDRHNEFIVEEVIDRFGG